MLSMMPRPLRPNWTYRRGSIPFDAIDAVHIGSTTLVHDRGAAEAGA